MLFHRTLNQREEAQVLVININVITITIHIIITNIIHHTITTIVTTTSICTSISITTLHKLIRMMQGLVEELWDLLQSILASARWISLR